MAGLVDSSALTLLYEEAVTAVGIHVAQGGLVWAHWRKHEQSTSGDATERIRAIWLRQAMVPCLEDASNALVAEYRGWEQGVGGDSSEGLKRFKEAYEVTSNFLLLPPFYL